MAKSVDVVIIGGGPAGLSAALVLGRARRSVLLIDEGAPRNRVTHESHGFLTRDKIAPAEFRAIARQQIAAYPSVTFEQGVVSRIGGSDGRFLVQTRDGLAVHSRKLLFATGRKDRLPSIEGLSAVYGVSAFVCPYCDGWELQDRPLVLIAEGAVAYHMAKVLKGWSASVTLCSDGPNGLSTAQAAELRRNGIEIHEAPIAKIDSIGGQVRSIWLTNGVRVACGGIFFSPELVQGSQIPERLGCDMTKGGAIVVSDEHESSLRGLFVAGDAARDKHQLIAAAADGALTAIAINGRLADADWLK